MLAAPNRLCAIARTVSGSELLLFMAASLAINLSPGPSILYVSTVAAARGATLAAGRCSVWLQRWIPGGALLLLGAKPALLESATADHSA